jgi:hypothetical protein
MRFGNYESYGPYGDVSSLLSTITSGVGKIAAAALEPMEIATPPELAGAKLTKGFKILKEGNTYKIVLAASIPGVPASWVGVKLGDPSVEQTFPVAAGISVKYIPAPSKKGPIMAGLLVAALGLGVAVWVLKPKKKKKRRRR